MDNIDILFNQWKGALDEYSTIIERIRYSENETGTPKDNERAAILMLKCDELVNILMNYKKDHRFINCASRQLELVEQLKNIFSRIESSIEATIIAYR